MRYISNLNNKTVKELEKIVKNLLRMMLLDQMMGMRYWLICLDQY